MKPCDCRDEMDCKKLKEIGLQINDNSIKLTPSFVILTIGLVSIKISQNTFKKFAEWYLEEQTPLSRSELDLIEAAKGLGRTGTENLHSEDLLNEILFGK